jgi:tetratricopeptide (TPR) repeat protein/TolB-like protein
MAGGAAVLLAAGSWFASSRGAGSGRGAPSLVPEKGSLLVMPILVEEPTPESGWLHHGLAEMIRSQLGQTPEIHVVARHRVSAALAEAGYGEEGVPTPDAAVAIARRLRAERLVTGSFVRVADRFVVNAQIVDVVSGTTAASASVRGKHPDDLLGAVDDLCLKMLHDLRPASDKPRDRVGQPGRFPTQSIEAYREYAEALSWFARGGRSGAEEAVRHLDAALGLDPSFALAYLRKAEIQRWRRQWGYGDPDPAPAVRAAARLVKDLPDRERLLVESFEALIVRKQLAAALEDWNALLQFYPTYAQEIGIPGLVADTFLRLGRWDDLILVGEAHVESPSLPDGDKAWLSSHLAQAFRQKGEFERALDHARRAARLWPVREGPRFLSQRTTLGRISLEAGRRVEALVEFRAVASAATADCGNLTDAAWGLYMAGEAEEARALVERALRLDSSYGNAFHLLGWLRLARRDYASAASALETAFERTAPAFGYAHVGTAGGDLAALYYAGVAYQKLGRKDRAEGVLRRLMEHCQRIQASGGGEKGDAARWQAANFLARAAARLGVPAPEPGRLQGDDTTYFVQSSRLHAVQGKRQLALRELAQALALGHGEHQHKRDDPDFESLRQEPEFKRLVG